MTFDNTPIMWPQTIVPMHLRDVPTPELKLIIQATEQTAGPESPSVAVLRRELVRRQQVTRAKRRKPTGGDR